jgi:hypothetical protein
VHSGSGNRGGGAGFTNYTNACVTNGKSDYVWKGWWDADAQNYTGSTAIWLR